MSEADSSYGPRSSGGDADPSGNTEAFQAFARRTAASEPEVDGRRRLAAFAVGAVAIIVVAIVVLLVVT
jgi:hypothetical protein